MPPSSAASSTTSIAPPSRPPRRSFMVSVEARTVLGGFLALFCSFGQLNAFGTFQAWYASHQLHDTPASTISWIGSLQLWIFFFSGCSIGRLFDQYGPKWLMSIGTLCFVSSLLLTSICTRYWEYLLAQGVLFGLGVGFLFYPSLSSISTRFTTYRATALGIAIAGSGLGGVVYPILFQHLFQHPKIGFAWGTRIAALVTFVGCVCAVLLVSTPQRKTQGRLVAVHDDEEEARPSEPNEKIAQNLPSHPTEPSESPPAPTTPTKIEPRKRTLSYLDSPHHHHHHHHHRDVNPISNDVNVKLQSRTALTMTAPSTSTTTLPQAQAQAQTQNRPSASMSMHRMATGPMTSTRSLARSFISWKECSLRAAAASTQCLQFIPALKKIVDVRFSLLAAGSSFVALGLFIPFFYIVSYAKHASPSSSQTYTYILSTMNAGSVLGRLLPAYLSDSLGRFNILVPCSLLAGLTTLGMWIPHALRVHSGDKINLNADAFLLAYAVLYGFFSGAFVSLVTPCVVGLGSGQSKPRPQISRILPIDTAPTSASASSSAPLPFPSPSSEVVDATASEEKKEADQIAEVDHVQEGDIEQVKLGDKMCAASQTHLGQQESEAESSSLVGTRIGLLYSIISFPSLLGNPIAGWSLTLAKTSSLPPSPLPPSAPPLASVSLFSASIRLESSPDVTLSPEAFTPLIIFAGVTVVLGALFLLSVRLAVDRRLCARV